MIDYKHFKFNIDVKIVDLIKIVIEFNYTL